MHLIHTMRFSTRAVKSQGGGYTIYMYIRTLTYSTVYLPVCAVIVVMIMTAMTVAAQSAPAAPTGTQGVAGDTKVTLFWGDPSDSTITGYEYQQKTGSGSYGNWTAIAGSSATTTDYTVTGLTNGTAYKYKIRAKAGSTAGTASSEIAVTPAADSDAPSFESISITATTAAGNRVVGGVTYLSTGDSITAVVRVMDRNPSSTPPTLTIKFGASGTERILTEGTPSLAYYSSNIITSYTYTYYSLVNEDVGTLRYKVTGVTDTAGTPNSMTDETRFTEWSQYKAEEPVTNIGIQAGSDSGADDDITNDDTAPVIEFTQTSGATITAKYRKSGAATYTAIQSTSISATGTAGTITLPNLTTDGDYELEITQQAPTAQPRTAYYTFTLDTVAPSVYIGAGPFRPSQTPLKIGSGADADVTISLDLNSSFGAGSARLRGRYRSRRRCTVLMIDTANAAGAVYLFEKQNGVWTQSLKISNNDGCRRRRRA